MNMHQLIDDYCIWHEVSGHSPKTIAWYRWNLGTFTRWLTANNRPTMIAQITVADARAFLQAETQRTTLRPDHPTGTERLGSLSDRTLHCYARSIRAFFNWLVAENTDFLLLHFPIIETIIGGALPAYVRQHRSWWANDSVSHPQSQQWLEVGWRVARVNLQQETVAFARIQEREQAYINFWSKLHNQLQASANVPLRNFVSHGESWITIVNIPRLGNSGTFLGCSFARRGRFRVEIYVDSGEQEKNKRLFDALYAHKADVEAAIGQPLSWERLDDRRASRIAIYTQGAITDSEEQLAHLRTWAHDTCISMFKSFSKAIDQVITNLMFTDLLGFGKNADPIEQEPAS